MADHFGELVFTEWLYRMEHPAFNFSSDIICIKSSGKSNEWVDIGFWDENAKPSPLSAGNKITDNIIIAHYTCMLNFEVGIVDPAF